MILNRLFKIALANRKKNLLQNILNTLCIIIGYVTFCMMMHYYFYEQSFDKSFVENKRIYNVRYDETVDGHKNVYGNAPTGFATVLRNEFPEVKHVTRLMSDDVMTIYYENEFHQDDVIKHIDSTFFDIFNYKFIKGNRDRVLSESNAAVITESCARKYFGNENPIGKSLVLKSVYGETWTSVVKGVVEDNPENSTIEFDIALSNIRFYNSFIFDHIKPLDNLFDYPMAKTYIEVNELANIEDLEKKMNVVIEKYKNANNKDRIWDIKFIELESSHLFSERRDDENFINETNNGRYLNFFLLLSVIVIMLIVINFSNLYLIEINERKNKIIFRNWIGEKKKYMLYQFVFENFIINSISVVVTIVTLYILRKPLNNVFDISIFNNIVSNDKILLIISGLFIVNIIIPSLMAFIAFNANILIKQKNKESIVSNKGGVFYNISTIFQFATAIIALVFTITVYKQYSYMFSKSTGLETEKTITLLLPTLDNSLDKYNKMKLRLKENENVKDVTGNRYLISKQVHNIRRLRSEHNKVGEYVLCCFNKVDNDFFEAFNVPLLSGEYLKLGVQWDGVIINESACRKFGFLDAKSAIGAKISRETTTFNENWTIVGVTKDFHQEKVSNKIMPSIYFNLNYWNQPVKHMYIKLNTNNINSTIAELKEIWSSYFPMSLFKYRFLDDIISNQYRNERRLIKCMMLFSIIFIFNMCLSLFSLSSYIMTKKTKEICIRRVIGATTGQSILAIIKDFYLYIIVSLLISIPVSFLLVTDFLNRYPYRINFPWDAILSTVAILIFTLSVSISYFIYKILKTDPGKVLKIE